MASYSENTIQEVIGSNDIVEVVSSYVQLKRAGRNYTGLCPFHKEKTPSFVVSPDKQIFHCFGCGEGGNVISFIMRIEGLEFVDALEFLASRAGMVIQSINNTNYVDKNKDIKNRIYEINKEAANHFYTNIYSPQGKIALDYLYNRKLDDNTIKKFGLGYSLNTNEMFQYLKTKGFTEDEILKSAVVEKKDVRYVDKFRNRLMFPIIDEKGRIIAFGGRVLDKSLPKYINSPDTLVYSKGKTLYAYNLVKKEHFDKVLIVEGYMDVISLHQREVNNVVASLGTALTIEQAKLLKNKQVVLGYDADSAGQAAILRGLDILKDNGCEANVLKLDAGDVKDPDEYIIKYGSARFKKLIDNAITLVEFKLQVLLQQYNIEKIDEKVKFLNEMAKILAKLDNDIELDVYVTKIANDTNISKDAIVAEVNKIKFKYSNDLKNVNNVYAIRNVKNVQQEVNTIDNLSKYVIYLLLENNVDIFIKIKDNIQLEDIENEEIRNIIKKLYKYYENKQYEEIDIQQLFSEQELNIISSTISLECNVINYEQTVLDIAKNIKIYKLQRRKEEIMKLLLEDADNKELLEELNKILIKIKSI
ncbi:MAG: DNA primase [Clostridia bacterium]|nr:DNA primase [Clostridia bacterium]